MTSGKKTVVRGWGAFFRGTTGVSTAKVLMECEILPIGSPGARAGPHSDGYPCPPTMSSRSPPPLPPPLAHDCLCGAYPRAPARYSSIVGLCGQGAGYERCGVR
uniref:Uncharacterized protein n=1 Tax=Eutreptiella gymnastica TaxID=73025 RepID=A0A7S4FU11_9EUGL